MRDDFDDFMEKQRQQARRRLGIEPGEHCAYPNCSEADPLWLTGSSDDLSCYEHRAIRQGRSPVEQHHPATKKVEPSFTVPIFGNDHRVLSVRSKRWIDAVKHVKDGDLQAALGRFFSLRDVERQMVERSGPVDDVILDLLRWLSVDRPGWEQDFERWRDSKDPRDS